MEIEMDYRWETEPSGFITARNQPIVIKSPEYASYSQAQYIASVYQDFEDAFFSDDGYSPYTGKYYAEYIDLDSFVRRYLIEELVKNMDTVYTSQFIVKQSDSEGGKMLAGPVWDYDKSLGTEGIVADSYDMEDPYGLYASDFGDTNIYRGLYQHEDFHQRAVDVYTNELSAIVKNEIESGIDARTNLIEASAMMNTERWDVFSESGTMEERKEKYRACIEQVKYFMEQRDIGLLWSWNELGL